MDIETIKSFIEAGYTKADIDAMQGGNGEGTESAKEKGNDDQQANLDTKPDIPQGAEIDPTIKALSDTVAELSATVKALQEKNANTADAGRKPTDKIKEVMDSFINEL